MSSSARAILLGFIVLFGFCARGSTYKTPIFDHHAWRQAESVSIGRNFYRERFNILYPQVDHRGSLAHGYVETGLEIYPFAVAALSTLGGFHHEIGRVLSSIFFVVSCLLVWTLVRVRLGDDAGLVAAFLHAFGFPLLLFIERAFMNEALLICLSISCLVAAQRYLHRPTFWALGWLVIGTSLIAAIKLPYLIVWGPIAGLFIERRGWRLWRHWELAVMAVVSLAVAAAWYSHAHRLYGMTGLTFGLTDKLFEPDLVFSLSYPVRMLDRLARDVLGPIGLIAVAAGLRLAILQRRWCEILGVASFVAYLVLVAVGNYEHDYYQLALMPIASLVAAPGILWIGERLAEGLTRTRGVTISATLAVAAVCTFMRLVSANSWFDYSAEDVVLCTRLRSVTHPEDRLVFVGDGNPQMLSCTERKGWLLGEIEADREHLNAAWREGARFAILTKSTQFADELRLVLAASGPPIVTSPAVEVYRLP